MSLNELFLHACVLLVSYMEKGQLNSISHLSLHAHSISFLKQKGSCCLLSQGGGLGFCRACSECRMCCARSRRLVEEWGLRPNFWVWTPAFGINVLFDLGSVTMFLTASVPCSVMGTCRGSSTAFYVVVISTSRHIHFCCSCFAGLGTGIWWEGVKKKEPNSPLWYTNWNTGHFV